MASFMPNQLSNWPYKISYKNIELSVEFECIKTNKIFHGLVETKGSVFSYTAGRGHRYLTHDKKYGEQQSNWVSESFSSRKKREEKFF